MSGKVDLEFINDLITLRSGESTTLEFKRELPDFSDRGKAELLKDVTAMANASGGVVLFGIDEDDGYANKLTLASIDGEDDLIRRIAQVLEAGIEPRLRAIKIHIVQLEGQVVLAIEVPFSFEGPHRFKHNKHARFVVRNDRHISDLTYQKLRSLFIDSERSRKEVQQSWDEEFRKKRFWTELTQGPSLFVRLSPMRLITNGAGVDLRSAQENWNLLMNHWWGGASPAYNHEGLVVYPGSLSEPTKAFNQLHRSGAITGWRSLKSDNLDENAFHGGLAISSIRRSFYTQMNFLESLGVGGPAFLHIGLRDIEGWKMLVPGRFGSGFAAESHIYEFEARPIWFEDLGLTARDDPEPFREAADFLWQSFGQNRCPDDLLNEKLN